MKTFFKWALVLPLIASMTMVGCNKDDDEVVTPTPTPPVDQRELIFTGTSSEAGVDIEVYADEALFVGYNRLYVEVYEAGTENMIKDAHVTFSTKMVMTAMTHSSPSEDPTTDTPADGIFQGAAVFVMPTSSTGTWTLTVNVKNNVNNLEGQIVGDVTIITPEETKMYSFVSATDQAKIFVSLVKPMDPQVGHNDYEVTIHTKQDMMTWPAVDGLTVEIEPEMPSMGHGSPDNVNPVFTANGHYLGMVNYTMTGLWKVNMTIKDAAGDVMNDTGYFEMSF